MLYFFGAISERFQIDLMEFSYLRENSFTSELKYCFFISVFLLFYHRAVLMFSFWEPVIENVSDAVICKFR